MWWCLSIVCGGFPLPLPAPLTVWLLLGHAATLEKSYYTVPHWRKVIINRHTGEKSVPHWRKVIGNRLFIKNPTNFIHLTLARGFSAATNCFSSLHRYLPTKVNINQQNQQKLGSKYESDQCSGSVANDLELFPAVCDLRCSLYKSEDQQ